MLTDAEKSLISFFAHYCTFSQMWETGRISKETFDSYTDTLDEHRIEIVTYFEEQRLETRAQIAQFLTEKMFPKA